MLWGERDEEHARHSLEQALYGLKSSLGGDPVQRTSTALILDPALMRADVAEFDRAVAAEDWVAAVSAYTGSFLDGVFVDDAPEFERWGERERSRRRDAYHRALEHCARAAQTRREPDDAVRWWRRLYDENPFRTRYVVEFAQALADAGERDEALRVAEGAMTRAATEGPAGARSEPPRDAAPELSALLARLRRGSPGGERESTEGSVTPDTLSAELGKALGTAYRIEGRVAHSRMYHAFRARDVQTGRIALVRVLEPSIVRFGDRRVLIQQLERLAAMPHEHLAGIESVRSTAHLIYLIGPVEDGETLLDRVKQRGELAVAEALTMARQIGSALEHAHTNGVLHLDVTPKRVLLTSRGALLRDTGVASAIRSAAQAAGGSNLDETNVVLGTAAFMSPELTRAEGKPNELSDLFSLAAVIFHCLTGVLPFGTAGAGAQLRATAPSAAAIRPSVPRHVDAALSRALAPVRSDRPPSVADFLREIAPS